LLIEQCLKETKRAMITLKKNGYFDEILLSIAKAVVQNANMTAAKERRSFG